jgi:hypothetical protein
MGKSFFSTPRIKLLFVLMIGISLFHPPDLFAKNSPGDK